MEIEKYNQNIFKKINHIDEYGFEFQYARELQIILEYKQWRRFKDAKLRRDKVNNEYKVCSTNYEIGKDIRKFIRKHGGKMPEELPTPKTSIKKLK